MFGVCSFSAYDLFFLLLFVFFSTVCISSKLKLEYFFFSTSEVALLHYCEAQDFIFFFLRNKELLLRVLNDRSQLCVERRLGGDEESCVLTLDVVAKEKMNK